ncbi:hypothetical protein OKC48_07255 [Methylorubrum extorquens]|uniref:hypothetical protein n=1 Tax=Methylorubrum extorquens TaxID=408 RepID=UPI002237B3C9|nr:hypothetical protein [Methylorubrum extorquens]UYW28304.1 hypothetical protein OKC48_07255 [Methylorubrum extorquens]
MTETFRTGLAALPTVTLTWRRNVMGQPSVRRSRHALVRALRVAGEPRGGYLVSRPDGAEIGVLVCVKLGRPSRFVVVPMQGAGPTLAIEGRHDAAGSLAFHVVLNPIREAAAEAREEARAEQAPDDDRLDPFDRDALAGLRPEPVLPRRPLTAT